jgi:hypothetical protein
MPSGTPLRGEGVFYSLSLRERVRVRVRAFEVKYHSQKP